MRAVLRSYGELNKGFQAIGARLGEMYAAVARDA
jgi:hypothetical protein